MRYNIVLDLQMRESILASKPYRFILKKHFFKDFKNAVILQPLNEFLCPTPEMKARDAYVPFLVSKS